MRCLILHYSNELNETYMPLSKPVGVKSSKFHDNKSISVDY